MYAVKICFPSRPIIVSALPCETANTDIAPFALKHYSTSLYQHTQQESQLPLTDPRDAVPQRMLNIPYRITW